MLGSHSQHFLAMHRLPVASLVRLASPSLAWMLGVVSLSLGLHSRIVEIGSRTSASQASQAQVQAHHQLLVFRTSQTQVQAHHRLLAFQISRTQAQAHHQLRLALLALHIQAIQQCHLVVCRPLCRQWRSSVSRLTCESGSSVSIMMLAYASSVHSATLLMAQKTFKAIVDRRHLTSVQ